MKKITIALDGFSSTGKSTLAKQIAKQLGYVYVDTGAMYRAIALYAMQNNWVNDKQLLKQDLIAALPNVQLKFVYNPTLGFAEMYLNGENVEKQIRSLEVSNQVSKIAAISEVRAKLVEQQQNMGKDKGIVMDGRDIGTVVFPDADLKLFMTADAATRAKRRYEELVAKGDDVAYDEVLKNVQERDLIDSTRTDSPLIKAEDAIAIDNSNLSKDEQYEQVMQLVQSLLN
ncbi:(d)CMP kinase [Flavobacterium agricola]|uniref:Cytidylate kinase n=1 Tax=Flavobacterium agricola TaxID=2870839 RepID=A0ABY6M1X4_9FLAO|nr:(d)CMP kinase [Flavobacterium agricola]UYW02540.1 (d)CMP kinase [Flavobacterium agricola]